MVIIAIDYVNYETAIFDNYNSNITMFSFIIIINHYKWS